MISGSQLLLFLKAVFVLSRVGRRPWCRSCLSFLFCSDAFPPRRGGDPFSHPSGSSVARPARVTVQTAVLRLASALRRTPSSRSSGSQKTFSAQSCSFSRDKLWLAPFHTARPTFRRLTAGSNHHKFFGPCASAVGLQRETSRCHSVPLAQSVQTPSLVHGRSPQMAHGLAPPKTRCGS